MIKRTFRGKMLKSPKDVKEMTEKYKIDRGGICGQACLAVIEQSTISEVMKNWDSFGFEFKGWSGWKQLKDYLKKRGFIPTQRNQLKEYNTKFKYIARVQFIGDKNANKQPPFYGWGHWSEASAHTHFIVICDRWFFCNEDGWFKIGDLKPYLEHYDAVITSHIEVKEFG